MKQIFQIINYFVAWMFIILAIYSCNKFEGGQTIPSYIQIDTIFLESNHLIEEGFLTHNFEDVWVYVDGELIGAFELPVDNSYSLVIPILAEGKHKLKLKPGIKNNGISGTRVDYPFIEPYSIPDFNFVIDSIQIINPTVSYLSNTNFAWIEDFENGTSSLAPTPNSDTSIQFMVNSPASEFYGTISGVGYFDDNHPVLECATNASASKPTGFELPAGAPVFLEVDYNSNEYFSIGLFIRELGVQIIKHPIVVITPTNGVWKKMYINLSPTVSNNPQADHFNVFVLSEKAEQDTPVIKLDNLKLIHLDF